MSDLIIQQEFEDNTYRTMSIEGLSPDEMDAILANHDRLADAMEAHGALNTYVCWHNGYGIYRISHVGGILFVKIGKSCD